MKKHVIFGLFITIFVNHSIQSGVISKFFSNLSQKFVLNLSQKFALKGVLLTTGGSKRNEDDSLVDIIEVIKEIDLRDRHLFDKNSNISCLLQAKANVCNEILGNYAEALKIINEAKAYGNIDKEDMQTKILENEGFRRNLMRIKLTDDFDTIGCLSNNKSLWSEEEKEKYNLLINLTFTTDNSLVDERKNEIAKKLFRISKKKD